MNPWTVLGWLLLALVALAVLAAVVRFARVKATRWRERFAVWRQYRRTRNDEPKPGDVWEQDTFGIGYGTLHIQRIASNGRIVIGAGSASWSDSPEEWRIRVKERRARRVSP